MEYIYISVFILVSWNLVENIHGSILSILMEFLLENKVYPRYLHSQNKDYNTILYIAVGEFVTG
jgi:hypothetical protein